jgi:hypothetical protein
MTNIVVLKINNSEVAYPGSSLERILIFKASEGYLGE